jgi:hypothetical protein
MSKYTTRARSGSDRTSLYDEITTKIIDEKKRARETGEEAQGMTHELGDLRSPCLLRRFSEPTAKRANS